MFCVADEQAQNESSGLRVVGEPLHAHRLVLWSGSKRFRVMIEGWNQHDTNSDDAEEPSAKRRRVEPADGVSEGSSAHGKQSQRPDLLPLAELRVTLDREEELEAALAAIRFMYTGSLVVQQEQPEGPQGQGQRQALEQQRQEQGGACSSGGGNSLSVGELLVVWHMAELLEIVDCAKACYTALVERFGGPAQGRRGSSRSSRSSSSNSSSLAGSPLTPVLELYSFRHLLPSPEHHPWVRPVLTACRKHLWRHWDAELPGDVQGPEGTAPPTKVDLLVWHLGCTDAVRLANDPQLLQLWKELPEAAVEELLQSDHLSTDDEATVVFLVEAWLNGDGFGFKSLAHEARMLRQLRLVNCNTCCLLDVLPKANCLGPNPAGQAAFLARCQRTDRSGWRQLGEQLGGYDTTTPWYGKPRPQPPVPERGLHSYRWEVSKQQLLSALEKAQPQATLYAKLKRPGGDGVGTIVAFGFQWNLSLELSCGCTIAALKLHCRVPPSVAYQVPGAFRLSADVGMPDGAGGMRAWHLKDVRLPYGDVWGSSVATRLEAGDPGAEQQGQGQQGQQGGAGEANAQDMESQLLAPWSKLLGPDGMISGTLEILGVASEAGAEEGGGAGAGEAAGSGAGAGAGEGEAAGAGPGAGVGKAAERGAGAGGGGAVGPGVRD